MGHKHFKKLGKTKVVRLPEMIADWSQKIARELDAKENPQEILETLEVLLRRLN